MQKKFDVNEVLLIKKTVTQKDVNNVFLGFSKKTY